MNAEDLQQRLTTDWLGRTCQLVEEVDSTNTLAALLAEEGAPHGLVVVAESQTAGRGRMQRFWHSPRGLNLYFSLLLRPQWNLEGSPPLSLAAGVAMAEAIAPLTIAPPQLKWPNDVLHQGRKLAGILVEAAAQRQQVKHVVIGIGVNVNQQNFPPELADRATSLSLASGRAELDRTELLAILLGRLEDWIDCLPAGSASGVIERWRDFAPWLGSEVCVTHGGTAISGKAINIEPNGSLRLCDAEGRQHLIHCGDATAPMWPH